MSFLATTRSTMLAATVGISCVVAMSGAANAEPSISIDVDDARMVKISGQPSALVVSNPFFADASIQGDKLVLIGKNTGRTKIIVLDLDGNQIANMMVKVQRTEANVVSLFRGGARQTLHCEPFCDNVLTVNDDAGQFKSMIEQSSGKTAASTGAASTSTGSPGQ